MPAEVQSTYRLQLRPGFGFAAARRLTPYLRALGVSHAFASPVLQAAPGSAHGYDVADPTRVSRELGGPAEFLAWARALRQPRQLGGATSRADSRCPLSKPAQTGAPESRSGTGWRQRPTGAAKQKVASHLDMGLVLDFVPNHMTTVSPANRWWWDVLRRGRQSPYARCFDVDWSQPQLRYRRFFDVDSLVGMRVEDPAVMAATHKLALQWTRHGQVDGLRLDHVDGLRDPARYLRRLHRAAPRAWIVVEKILTGPERLRKSWPVAGTTGYDFLNLVLGLLVAPRGRRGLERAYRAFAGPQPAYPVAVRRERIRVLRGMFAGEVERLRAQTHASSASVEALAAACPVYRSYVAPRGPMGPDDRAILRCMARDVTSPEAKLLARRLQRGQLRRFTLGLQQFTPAVFAKAVEDTVSYQYVPLVALNEVGGNPLRFGVSVAQFHAACRRMQRDWPRTQLSTGTHDTKRGEDVRARLALLSEIPAEWGRAVQSWARMTERYRRPAGPDRNLQYLFFQTLVGAWPISAARLRAYMRKAAREAKQHTSWRHPNPAYEAALRAYVEAVMRDSRFLAAVERWLRPLLDAGWINSLTQLALKLTAPGVPDIYNGAELWELSLVDPDNRRAVDFRLRQRLLRELERGMSAEAIWARRAQGLPKLWLTRQALRLRRRCPLAFSGSYRVLPARGPQSGRVIAFVRGGSVATVAQRFPLRAAPWRDTHVRLPRGPWSNSLTGDRLAGGATAVGEILRRFPVAILERAA